jgi:hypothetical protein
MNGYALLSALALTACAAAPAPLPPPDAEVRPVAAKDRLDGQWTVAALNGRAMSGMSIEISGPSLRAVLACNGGVGIVSRNGDKLNVQQLAMTRARLRC